ncbi:flagellar hook-basal body complex protein FliE [Desulfonispora thiosulfatigenes DSM 11270]|uniref:Flagellar hook-basal body complex protein FliE n=1 Tax=Desulfonispora thiosulfatigenes DSM 11270 TaxID=656914 RepID=A0A1W1UN97_DESTI|nr:flagellar hook-basal body complex protein FliE [Desulfonispora thiosulfatigenes]SMB82493.1 flagellar hook-basal body complex protein FliE [Desulfonispora thiosulfatigenes DSM 11270]
MKISLLNPQPLVLPNSIKNTEKDEKNDKPSFGNILQQNLDKVNNIQKEADKITESFLAGEPVELHDVMLSMEKADLAMQLTVQVRNKLVQSYKEISQMQI